MTLPRIDKPVAALLILATLAGCTTAESCLDNGQPRRSPAPDAGGQVKDRYLDDATQFLGTAWDFQCGDLTSSTRLKSVRDKASGRVSHQLIVKHNYEATGWYYYHQATALQPDEALRLSVVERQVGKCHRVSWMGCQHSEEVALEMPEPLLAAASSEARQLRITSKDGKERKTLMLWLTPDQVREHLDFIKATPR